MKVERQGSCAFLISFIWPLCECVSLLSVVVVAFCSVCLLAENYLFYFWFRCRAAFYANSYQLAAANGPAVARQLKAKLMLN